MQNRFFVKAVLDWHRYQNDRQLPWKNEKDPYKIWLSEIILQQTRVAQGLSYYNKFTNHFPTIGDLANADENLVFKLWEGLGYYNRCRNLIATAQFIDKENDGIFPDTYDGIIALKGVGPYTAAAIASFAFGLSHAVVDGNVTRVLSRYFGIGLATDSAVGKRRIKELADTLIDKDNPSEYNQAIMDFGATVCKPADAQCTACPLQTHCRAYNDGIVHLLPHKSKRVTITHRAFNFFLIGYPNHLYIRQRREKDIWQNLFELPQIETKELLTKQQIARRKELQPLLNDPTFRIDKISAPVKQRLTHRLITAQFIHISSSQQVANLMGARPLSYHEIEDLAFPKIVAKYLFDFITNDLL